MFKKLLLISLTTLSLWAADYSRCAERLALSMEKVGGSYAIALNEGELLYYGKTAPSGFKIIKSDPFLGFYLLQSKKKMVPLELRDINEDTLKSTLGVGSPQGFTIGQITKRMEGFLDYAQFSEPTPPNSVISSICYQFYGIGTGNGFIETSQIKRFLEGNNFVYGDLGVLVMEENKKFIVDYAEPFINGIELQMGDEILELNHKTPQSLKELQQAIYTLKPDTEVSLKIRRNGELMDIKSKVLHRTGGMLLPYQYLSALGIQFSSDWTIQSLNPPQGIGFEKLEIGDQILKINDIDMPQNFEDGVKLISKESKKAMKLLIIRNGFQFFVTINKQKGREWGGFLGE